MSDVGNDIGPSYTQKKNYGRNRCYFALHKYLHGCLEPAPGNQGCGYKEDPSYVAVPLTDFLAVGSAM